MTSSIITRRLCPLGLAAVLACGPNALSDPIDDIENAYNTANGKLQRIETHVKRIDNAVLGGNIKTITQHRITHTDRSGRVVELNRTGFIGGTQRITGALREGALLQREFLTFKNPQTVHQVPEIQRSVPRRKELPYSSDFISYNKERKGVHMTVEFTVDDRQAMLETFNSNPSGAFISIQGYESVNGHGEVANYQLQSGIHYDRIKQMSIDKLKQIQAGVVVPSVHVKCQTWRKPDGTFTNRKAKDRSLVNFEQDYKWSDPEFQMACDELMEGLINPKKVEQPYEREANGLYSVEDEILYIRECLVLDKTIVQSGVRPTSATEPFTALKRSIKHLLPVDNYRTFKLDGRFEKVSINHAKVLPTVE